MDNIKLGTISVDVELQPNKKFDVYIADDCCSGCHYTDVTPDDIGRMVADYIECLAEDYDN